MEDVIETLELGRALEREDVERLFDDTHPAAVEALKAGVDLLLVPGSRAEQDDAYRKVVAAVRRGDIRPGRVVRALERIAALRRFTRRTRTPAAAR